jgi:hypothetical protein
MLDRRAAQVVAGLAQPAALVVAQEVAAGLVRHGRITAVAAVAAVAVVLLLNGEAKYEKSFD